MKSAFPISHSAFTPLACSDRHRGVENTRTGFTLVELLIGAAILAIAISALLGAFLGQVTLNEHARNLTWAINDANRVMERLRQLNGPGGCTTSPNATAPVGTSWDAWLADTSASGGGGRSVQPDELIVVTCLRNIDPPYAVTGDYCDNAAGGGANQIGTGEWRTNNNDAAPALDPIRITVAVCWRHRQRVLGECTWNGTALVADDTVTVANDTAGVIDSPATLSTVITCRQ